MHPRVRAPATRYPLLPQKAAVPETVSQDAPSFRPHLRPHAGFPKPFRPPPHPRSGIPETVFPPRPFPAAGLQAVLPQPRMYSILLRCCTLFPHEDPAPCNPAALPCVFLSGSGKVPSTLYTRTAAADTPSPAAVLSYLSYLSCLSCLSSRPEAARTIRLPPAVWRAPCSSLHGISCLKTPRFSLSLPPWTDARPPLFSGTACPP